MKQLRIRPYVGKKYDEGWNGKKILILGESHYSENKDDVEEMTNDTIRDFINNDNEYEGWKSTFTCFERVLTNKELSQAERKDLWSRVIFYQFIQYVQDGPREAPKEEEIELSRAPFIEVVKSYKPDYIIVWGKRLYDYLPDLGGELEYITIDETSLPVWKYNIEGKVIPAMAINHPSSPHGKSREKWHPFIETFLNKKFEMGK